MWPPARVKSKPCCIGRIAVGSGPDLNLRRKPIAAHGVDGEVGAVRHRQTALAGDTPAGEAAVGDALAQGLNLGDKSVAFRVRIERDRPADLHGDLAPGSIGSITIT